MLPNDVLLAQDKKNEVATLLFDLSKAFNTVDHHRLLQKLNSIGVRGVPYEWIHSYLTGRSQMVTLTSNGQKFTSPAKNITQGVPQGSILGPLLFLVYINDLPDYISSSNKVTPILYADDTNFILSSPNLQSLSLNCQTISDQFIKWCLKNRLVVNIDKSQVLHFAQSKNLDKSFSINIQGTSISPVNCVKFLGVHIDSLISWDTHISILANKLSSVCYLIRTIRPTVATDILLTLYYGLFYSHVTYSILLWGSSPSALKIFKIQKRIIRLIALAGLRTSCRPLFNDLKILPLPCVYMMYAILFIKGHLKDFTLNSDVHCYSTRRRYDIHVPYVRTKKSAMGPSNMGLHLYNKLPNVIKQTKSIVKFKRILKTFFLSKLYYSVDEFLSDSLTFDT
jgi:hypothetical protein